MEDLSSWLMNCGRVRGPDCSWSPNPETAQRKDQSPLTEEMKAEPEIKALPLAFKLQSSTEEKHFIRTLGFLKTEIRQSEITHETFFCYKKWIIDMIKGKRYVPLIRREKSKQSEVQQWTGSTVAAPGGQSVNHKIKRVETERADRFFECFGLRTTDNSPQVKSKIVFNHFNAFLFF